MNIYRITHKYAPRNMHIVISSNKPFSEIWNLVVMFQHSCSEIDSSHDVTPAGAATYLIKYHDAIVFNPDCYYDESTEKEIDLYLAWEIGFIDKGREINSSKEFIRIMDELPSNYKFYQTALYSFILDLITRDHKLFDGSVGCSSSFEMNSKVWDILFSEGVYTKEDVLLMINETGTAKPKKLSSSNDPRSYTYNQEKVEDVKYNIGMFLARLIDEDMLSIKFPDTSICSRVGKIMHEVSDLLLHRISGYTYLSEEYRVEWWRCIRLLREIFELDRNVNFGGNKQTLQNIDELVELYKDAESKYMSS